MRLILWLWLLTTLYACHNTQRDNPLDPELTPEVEIITAAVDPIAGRVQLEWTPYIGRQPFAYYQVLRRARDLAAADTLAQIYDRTTVAFADTTIAPQIDYVYQIAVVNQHGFSQTSPIQEAAYDLPTIELIEATLSHESAIATLAWTRYQGPGFTGYEVRRRSGLLASASVRLIEDVEQTGYIDSLLNGNTLYEYRVIVRTRWDGIEVESNALSDAFYQLVEQIALKSRANSAAHALGLTLDAADGLYVGSTLILTTTAGTIERGLWIQYPDGVTRRYFQGHTPDRLSAIHIAVRAGTVYVTVRTEDGQLLVGAIDAERNEQWLAVEDLGDIFPIGLFVDTDGKPTVVDAQGRLYRFGLEGQLEDIDERLNNSLSTDQALPLRHLYWDREPNDNGDQQLFIVAPDRPVNHLVGRVWTGTFFGGRSIVYDDGVGPQNGQTLNPLVAAYDRLYGRVAVLEENGRLQIMRADQQAQVRYLTQWGTFGEGEGEFALSPPTLGAMAIDSAGRIYIADGAGDEGRVQIFAP